MLGISIFKPSLHFVAELVSYVKKSLHILLEDTICLCYNFRV